MEPQRYRCAPIAALLLAGVCLALLPARARAQDFSAGLKMGWHDGNDWIDRRHDERRHHFDRRRLEEARFEMMRAFEDRHDAWHEREFDRREHHGDFTAGLKLREEGERDRADPHSRVADGARRLARPADEMEWKAPHHAHDGERSQEKMSPMLAKKSSDVQPTRANTVPGNSVGNRVASTAAPGVAKNGPGNDGNRQAGLAFYPQRGNFNNDGPGNLVGNRAYDKPPVAAPPGAAKNGQGGQMHHHVKNGAGKQGQQACAKLGQGNQAANKNASNGGQANGLGKKNGGPGNLVGNRFANPNVPANAAANNSQAPNGNQGMQACAKQGPGNFAGSKNANNKNGVANLGGNNKTGNTGNFAQAQQTLVNLVANRSANNPMHQAGSNKNGAGNALNQSFARNGAGHTANAAAVKTAPMQHAAHAAVAKQGHGNASVGHRK
jgi:hypothetical protein